MGEHSPEMKHLRLPHPPAAVATAICLILTAAGTFALAGGNWNTSTLFRATIHRHTFDKVEAYNQGCMLYSKLYFTAPAEAYNEEAPVRNHYRFKARVTFRNGKQSESKLFFSRSPARRSYTLRHDTSSDGCWASHKQHVADVRVEGCRGEGCRVKPFE